jgi:hypothetical protein
MKKDINTNMLEWDEYINKDVNRALGRIYGYSRHTCKLPR